MYYLSTEVLYHLINVFSLVAEGNIFFLHFLHSVFTQFVNFRIDASHLNMSQHNSCMCRCNVLVSGPSEHIILICSGEIFNNSQLITDDGANYTRKPVPVNWPCCNNKVSSLPQISCNLLALRWWLWGIFIFISVI